MEWFSYYFDFIRAKPGIKILSNMSEFAKPIHLNPDNLILEFLPPWYNHHTESYISDV